ncbi:unnamed protein product [Hymenolepis diminuta]|uniref:Uncharacterized protein n=1 Tax=Hymenolepis diminuta TaxID=6216 RepID=A0A564YE97_HYMDI|nr:unnamed protein product [Hymenolepis diminuta]
MGMEQQKTTPHPGLNDRSPAEIHMGRKPKTTYKAFLPQDLTFHGSFSCVKKTHTISTGFYVRYHGPNDTWVEDIVRAQRGSMVFEWICVVKLGSVIGTISILDTKQNNRDCFDNNETSETQPNNQQNFRSERPRKPQKDLRWI